MKAKFLIAAALLLATAIPASATPAASGVRLHRARTDRPVPPHQCGSHVRKFRRVGLRLVAQTYVICPPEPFTKETMLIHLAERLRSAGGHFVLKAWSPTLSGPSGQYLDGQAAIWCKWINVFSTREWRLTWWYNGWVGDRIAEGGEHTWYGDFRCTA